MHAHNYRFFWKGMYFSYLISIMALRLHFFLKEIYYGWVNMNPNLHIGRRTNPILTLFRMGFFGAAHGLGRAFWPPLCKIHHTYPTMMKLGTVIPYLRKIQKMYKSHDTSLEFCWHQHFFTRNQQILLHQEITHRLDFDT